MVKEYPILFSGEMVRAIIAGNKMQTRRVKGLEHINKPFYANHMLRVCEPEIHDTKKQLAVFSVPGRLGDTYANCPYGLPGDLLWVRENFALLGDNCDYVDNLTGYPVAYQANCISLKMAKETGVKWSPSIHLKKEFARIWLEITNIRCERLLDISEKDAIAEGVEGWPSGISLLPMRYQCYKTPVPVGSDSSQTYFAARQSFIELWETINEDLTNTNPWVWVIEFKVLSTTGKPVMQESEVANA